MTNKSLLIHNPNCSKSRSAKEILEEKGISFEILEYLNTPLPDEILRQLPQLLKLEYPEMIRQGEKLFTELDLKTKSIDQQEWMSILKAHPILLERPIFIHQKQAIIARPPEKLLEIL